MKNLVLHPLFILGLALRITIIFISQPIAVSEWYAPFIESSIEYFSFDPWLAWLSDANNTAAFPYGYAMWLTFLPLSVLLNISGFEAMYGYMFTLLLADLLLLFLLRHLVPGRPKLLLVAYWLSPIVIFASYGLGLNDLIPVLSLTLSLLFTKKLQLKFAGIACVVAVSAKLSMILAIPFFLIYFYNRRSLRQLIHQYLLGLLIGSAIFIVPFLFSSSGLSMLLSNPEMGKIYHLSISLGENVSIYVIPLFYLVMLYSLWRVRGLNFDLFFASLGMAFLLVVLMVPITPGWFVWVIPLLVSYQAKSGWMAVILVSFFSGLYILSSLLVTPILLINNVGFDLSNIFNGSVELGNHAASLVHTIMVATGAVLVLHILRETINHNDYFRLSQKPFTIGIAGDYGAGKGSFANSIQGLFGSHSVAQLTGNDYRLWDQQKPIWQVMTHLNPKANDLEGFTDDLVCLIDGKDIHLKKIMHKKQRMNPPHLIKSNDVIVASGLHALYLPILRDCYNLSIYLDMDESLRRYLMINNSQSQYLPEDLLALFDRREPDSKQFIQPQESHADLVLSVQPIHSCMLDNHNEKQSLRYKLVVLSRHGLSERLLTRVLIGVCGLHVDMEESRDACNVKFTIEGETSAEDISLAAKMICPRIFEFLDINPSWQDGIAGLMQLITLSHINQALTKRFIW